MTPVPQSLLDKTFRDALTKRFSQGNLEGRSSVESYLKKLDKGYDARTLSAFVDDLEQPSFFLIIGVSPSLLLDDPTCIIHFIYGTAEGVDQRANREDALRTAEAYGTLHGCGDILASSWTYLGDRDHSALWNRLGFDEQERTFTKLL